MALTAEKTNSNNVKDNQITKNMILTGKTKKYNLLSWTTFTFPASLFGFSHFVESIPIFLVHFFERSGIVPICVVNTIIAI